VNLNKVFNRAVVGLFRLWWEETARQLTMAPVMRYALATKASAAAGICACTVLLILLLFAFHEKPPCCEVYRPILSKPENAANSTII
jgi:hypothetical protein